MKSRPPDDKKPSLPPASTSTPPDEPRVVVNASLLDDVEVHSELPAGLEVWTPGGAARAPSRPAIPAKVDLWVPDGGFKGPQAGGDRNRATLPPVRAQQPTMLVPIAKRRHRTNRVAALAVAALVAALTMLAVVLAWRHWSRPSGIDPGSSPKNDVL